MTNTEQLVDRHIREYEARLKHVDELMTAAEKSAQANTARLAELQVIKQERDKLGEELHAPGQQAAIDWSEKAGPMVMWDVVAERLEHLVERVEHWRAHH